MAGSCAKQLRTIYADGGANEITSKQVKTLPNYNGRYQRDSTKQRPDKEESTNLRKNSVEQRTF